MAAPPKPRPLMPAQITAIYEAIEPEFKLVFLLMAYCGLRRNEAMHLIREQVELDSGVILVTGKGRKERIVRITTYRLMAELLKRKETKGWLTINPSTKRPYLNIRKALLRNYNIFDMVIPLNRRHFIIPLI
ncbi:MAG: tyrosine-type recombinase/integrase, partial [Desulfobulbaceae bacterium]|nr:tyrosine-type recombinase/integrase [Desulfobulbaceae bacterium]